MLKENQVGDSSSEHIVSTCPAGLTCHPDAAFDRSLGLSFSGETIKNIQKIEHANTHPYSGGPTSVQSQKNKVGPGACGNEFHNVAHSPLRQMQNNFGQIVVVRQILLHPHLWQGNMSSTARKMVEVARNLYCLLPYNS